MGPEVLSDMIYTPACDIYSLGVIMFILLSGTMPFSKSNKGKILVSDMLVSVLLIFI
jgi:serine/threonine protein kinase